MSDSPPRQVELKDGRRARVIVHGPADGRPLVYLHGIPASASELAPDDALLEEHGVRLYCVERPGVGDTDGPPAADFPAWADWLTEVVDRLGLQQFALMGLSTGGVYAMAMAALRPERVSRIVLCETPAPMVGWDALDGMEDSVRPLWELAATSPQRLTHILESLTADPERLVDATRATLPAADLAAVDAGSTCGRQAQSIRESIRQGYDALAAELQLVSGDWGFEPDTLAHPVIIFHGDLDQNIPPSHSRQLADRLPRGSLRALPGYGHYGLFHRSVLAAMLEAACPRSKRPQPTREASGSHAGGRGSDRVAVVTGASSGIGAATARRLAAAGMRVMLAARRADRLRSEVEAIRDAGGIAEYRVVDVTDRHAVQRLADDTLDLWGRIDVLVNNAGIMPLSRLKLCRVKDWDAMIDVNIRGVLHGVAAVLPVMERQQDGHIVSISSVAGLRVGPAGAVYSATKFAVRAIAEGIRLEGREWIRSTVICPGAIDTELPAAIPDERVAPAVAELYRLAVPADAVAAAVEYAVSQPPEVDVNEIVVRPTAQAF